MIEAIIFYLLLIDSAIANLTAIFWKKQFNKRFGKIIPINLVWTLLYLVLVLWIGLLLLKLGIL